MELRNKSVLNLPYLTFLSSMNKSLLLLDLNCTHRQGLVR